MHDKSDKSCSCCGNTYDKAFEVVFAGETYTFDCFECAAHVLAPRCAHCSVAILGHGLEADGRMYCCAHCARHEGVRSLHDRAGAEGAEALQATSTT